MMGGGSIREEWRRETEKEMASITEAEIAVTKEFRERLESVWPEGGSGGGFGGGFGGGMGRSQ